jgi:pentatricopeptide repeat protein
MMLRSCARGIARAQRSTRLASLATPAAATALHSSSLSPPTVSSHGNVLETRTHQQPRCFASTLQPGASSAQPPNTKNRPKTKDILVKRRLRKQLKIGGGDRGAQSPHAKAVMVWSSTINKLGRDGTLHQMERCYKDMVAADVAPNVVTFTAMVTAYARRGDVDGARSVLERMRERRIKPNVLTFAALMRSYYYRNNDVRGMLRVMTEVGSSANAMMEDVDIVSVAVSLLRKSLTICITMLTCDHELRALCTVSASNHMHHLLTTLFHLITHYTRCQMAAAGVRPNSVALTTVIQAYAKAGDLPAMMDFFFSMGRFSAKPDVYT